MADSQPPDSRFDMKVSELQNSLESAAAAYSPAEVREIVGALFTGQNYRRLTEKPTRQAISVFAGWILNVTHRAVLEYGSDWQERLLAVVSRKGAASVEKWLGFWLLGLTQKTAVNLGVRTGMQADYQKAVKAATQDLVKLLGWEPSTIELSARAMQPASLSAADSLWLLQIAGAAVLTIRGSKKSIAGKRLEKAIARAALNALGLTEGQHFWLNVERDREVEREVDAEILTRRGRIRMDIALIGTGNQEVSEDKLGRVGRHGVVLVDILGPKSQVLKNAARHEIKVIQLRNNFALSELYNHLDPLMPAGISLSKPAAGEKRLKQVLRRLPDSVFALPT
ncbi:MAG: CfrBI family restriction endonuclease [Chloroflexi bacterium]|nr:CfrBI family restriction endonuclease [Chloroflexota bacterium]